MSRLKAMKDAVGARKLAPTKEATAERVKAKKMEPAVEKPAATAEPPKPKPPQQPKQPKKPKYGLEQRLPDGSKFSVTYSAAEVMWEGSLSVPGMGVFQGRKSGVFGLLRYLDQCYRLEAAKPPKAEPPQEAPKEPVAETLETVN